MAATEIARMTTEELEALPENVGELRGELKDVRDRFSGRVAARFAQLLLNWVDQTPSERGSVYSHTGCQWRRNPGTTVGIDVAYFTAETVAAQTRDSMLMVGSPVLAVEIPLPSDEQGPLDEKVAEYLAAGVAHVWVVNPRFQTVTLYRPDAPPVLRNVTDDLTAEPHLPGFRVPVARIFED